MLQAIHPRLPLTPLRKAAYPAVMLAAFLAAEALHRAADLSIFAGAYAAAIFAAGAVTLLEFAIPYDRNWQPRWAEVKNDLAFMLAVQILLPQALSLGTAALLLRFAKEFQLAAESVWPAHWPLAAQVALMLLAAEFLRYWLHVAAHNTSFLWRLHAVHHSPKRLYWLNVGRFHPLEKALQYLLDAFPFILLGAAEEALAFYFVFYAVNGFFQHSNVDARYGFLNYVVSGAELHRWHHSRLPRESNRNYGNNLIVWDLAFGSWFLPRDRRVGELGLLNRAYPQDFVSQMLAPLRPGLEKNPRADEP